MQDGRDTKVKGGDTEMRSSSSSRRTLLIRES